MKKTYIAPASNEIKLNLKNSILIGSTMSVGGTVNSGEGDARGNDGDDW